MAKISTYASVAPSLSDMLIGTDVNDMDSTKNFTISDIIALANLSNYVPYTGATGDVDLGAYGLTSTRLTVSNNAEINTVSAYGNIFYIVDNLVTAPGLQLEFANGKYYLGDVISNVNGTYVLVDDANNRIEFSKAIRTNGSTGTSGQILTSQGAGSPATWVNPTALYSATFFDTTTQNNGGATVANQVAINSTQNANGFTLGPNDRINVTNDGTYFFSASMQLTFTGGASNYNVTVWYTVNDVIVPNSAFTFTTTGAQNDQTLAVITDTIALTAGQYLKFYWWSQATGMKLLATAAGTSPTRPLSPSVNVSIFNVG
jgi:hypothetical protein